MKQKLKFSTRRTNGEAEGAYSVTLLWAYLLGRLLLLPTSVLYMAPLADFTCAWIA